MHNLGRHITDIDGEEVAANNLGGCYQWFSQCRSSSPSLCHWKYTKQTMEITLVDLKKEIEIFNKSEVTRHAVISVNSCNAISITSCRRDDF